MEWQKLSEEPLWNGYRKVIKRIFRKPDGDEADFEIKKEGDALCVVALTERQTILLTKQYRPGPEKTLLELPGGGKDKNETPEEGIKRELLEETGYTGDFECVGTSLIDAYSTGIRHNFIARNCRKVQEQQPDEHEHIEVVEVSLDEFRKHLRSGQLTDVTTGYLSLDYLNLL